MLAVLPPATRSSRMEQADLDYVPSTLSPLAEVQARFRPKRCRARRVGPQRGRHRANPVEKLPGAPGCTNWRLIQPAVHLRAPDSAALAAPAPQAATSPPRR